MAKKDLNVGAKAPFKNIRRVIPIADAAIVEKNSLCHQKWGDPVQAHGNSRRIERRIENFGQFKTGGARGFREKSLIGRQAGDANIESQRVGVVGHINVIVFSPGDISREGRIKLEREALLVTSLQQ